MNSIKEKSLSAGKYVDNKYVDTVVSHYKKERWVQNSERIGKDDSLSAWFSVKELEEFIEKGKQHGADGIKMYFGAYAEDNTIKPALAGRQTIVLVATKQKETSKGVVNKNIYFAGKSAPQILAYDGLKICPPYCLYGLENQVGVTIVDRAEKGFSII